MEVMVVAVQGMGDERDGESYNKYILLAGGRRLQDLEIGNRHGF